MMCEDKDISISISPAYFGLFDFRFERNETNKRMLSKDFVGFLALVVKNDGPVSYIRTFQARRFLIFLLGLLFMAAL